eukprot:CAMPEP_0184710700 /NCGR_PEP_ID=MMETSP0314-20130426/1463_1 /TAXON_ID=38298 /ORGANISM="Rhodella maculata, Strain CCMP 736" /LENGTH=98 /DNA_ID=CAMNT_0027172597 /DNA_START=103 /DNA_END=396 /DNA_ORIENTATION=+
MTRHSKNSTDGAVFTYHERQNMSGGSRAQRLGSDSLRPPHHCALSLGAPRHPVVTPGGIVFEKEFILAHLLAQKKKIAAGDAAASAASSAAATASHAA